MAIKANVSFTQKLGQPDFGSVGAGCSIEVELDSTFLAKDPAQLQEQLVVAYLNCRQAVQHQLTPFEQTESVLSHAPVHSNTNGRKRLRFRRPFMLGERFHLASQTSVF